MLILSSGLRFLYLFHLILSSIFDCVRERKRKGRQRQTRKRETEMEDTEAEQYLGAKGRRESRDRQKDKRQTWPDS